MTTPPSAQSGKQERALELLDLICQDSLESPLDDQHLDDGQVSAWFVELRDLIASLDD